jgi:CDP-diacylglycerol--serine O-phosphatidyltransferase
MLLLVGAFVFVSSDPPIVLFGLFVVYGLSGWGIMFWRWRRARHLTRMRHESGTGQTEPGQSPFAPAHTFQGLQNNPSSDAQPASRPTTGSPPDKPREPGAR